MFVRLSLDQLRARLALLAAIALGGAGLACKTDAGKPSPASGGATAPVVTIDTGGRKVSFRVELARTPDGARAGSDVARAPRRRRRDAVRVRRAPRAGLLDEEHAHPPRHDLHRARRTNRSASSRTPCPGPRRRAGSRGLSQYVLEIGGGLSAKLGDPRRPARRAPVGPRARAVTATLESPCSRRWRTRRCRDPQLVYEPKYDGIRALITVTPRARERRGRDRLAPRQRQDGAVPGARRGARRAGVAGARRRSLLDGEIVALDPEGRPAGFQRLQDRIHLGRRREIVARAAARRPWRSSRSISCATATTISARCRSSTAGAGSRRRSRPSLDGVIRLSPQVRGDGAALHGRGDRARGWEGLVVKDARSPYRPGRRSREWRKLKLVKRQEFVVGGFTEPRGSRARFGALLVGLPDRRRTAALRRSRRRRLLATRSSTGSRACSARARAATCPFGSVPADERAAALGAAGAGRRGAVRRLDGRGRTCATRSSSVCATTSDASRVRREAAARRGEPRRRRHARPRPPVAAPPGGRTRAGCSPTSSTRSPRAAAGRLHAPRRWRAARSRQPQQARCGRGSGSRRPTCSATTWTSSPCLLPVVRDRPLVMRRLPDGVDGHAFYQHRAPDDVPRGVRAAGDPRRRRPDPLRRRHAHDAPLHGPARRHLAGPLVLARRSRRTRWTSRPSISTRWTARRSRACATSRAGCATSSSRSASTAT